mmetsp:Transcript_17351/g.31420  ORF Transcript_17351/g.31420 Transcript_17351/m.31420 type:complete len:228 (-) Transcript_17351:741-1424(-)
MNRRQTLSSVQQRRGLIRQHNLNLVNIRPLPLLHTSNLLQRQLRKQLNETNNILITGIPPKLPIIILTQFIGIQPSGPPGGLAHFFTITRSNKRSRQRIQLHRINPPSQLHPTNHIPPLITPAQLKLGIMTTIQFQKVVRLQYHVVEFEKAKGRIALHALLDGFEAHHAVDGEVRSVVTEEFEVFESAQPVVVVDHDGVGGGCVAEGEECLEHLGDAIDVLLDGCIV